MSLASPKNVYEINIADLIFVDVEIATLLVLKRRKLAPSFVPDVGPHDGRVLKHGHPAFVCQNG